MSGLIVWNSYPIQILGQIDLLKKYVVDIINILFFLKYKFFSFTRRGNPLWLPIFVINQIFFFDIIVILGDHKGRPYKDLQSVLPRNLNRILKFDRKDKAFLVFTTNIMWFFHVKNTVSLVKAILSSFPIRYYFQMFS